MKFKLKSFRPHRIIRQLAQALHVDEQEDCLELFLDLPKKLGTGRLAGFEFSDGISLFMLNVSLAEELILEMPTNLAPPMILAFVANGSLQQHLGLPPATFTIQPMQSSITASKTGDPQQLELINPKSGEHKALLIFVDRKKYHEKVDCYIGQMPEQIQTVFEDVDAQKSFVYQGNNSYSITDITETIIANEDNTLVRSTIIEAKALELLAYAIRKVHTGKMEEKPGIQLRQEDRIKLTEARTILIQNMENPPTIKDLSMQIGMNQNKLKYGFKELFNSTIRAYIITIRLERARRLILTDCKSLATIAQEVGYTNYSHFSRLFKRQYNLLPREYAAFTTKRMQLPKGRLRD